MCTGERTCDMYLWRPAIYCPFKKVKVITIRIGNRMQRIYFHLLEKKPLSISWKYTELPDGFFRVEVYTTHSTFGTAPLCNRSFYLCASPRDKDHYYPQKPCWSVSSLMTCVIYISQSCCCCCWCSCCCCCYYYHHHHHHHHHHPHYYHYYSYSSSSYYYWWWWS